MPGTDEETGVGCCCVETISADTATVLQNQAQDRRLVVSPFARVAGAPQVASLADVPQLASQRHSIGPPKNEAQENRSYPIRASISAHRSEGGQALQDRAVFAAARAASKYAYLPEGKNFQGLEGLAD